MNDDRIKEKLCESAYIFAAHENPNPELGITQEYDRNIWDSQKDKDAFRKKAFDGKKTIYSSVEGKTLHISHNAAKKKYKKKSASKKWAQYAAEVDHRVSIKKAHTIAKNNLFLSDNDLKTIVNCEDNFQLLSKSLNGSKQDRDDLCSDTNSFRKKIHEQSLRNFGNELIIGAKNSLENSAGSIGEFTAEKIVNIAEGKESIANASVDTLTTVGKIVANGAGARIIADTLNASEKNIELPNEIKTLEIAAVTSTLRNGVHYISGDMTELEAFKNIAIDTGTTAAVDIGAKLVENGCTALSNKVTNEAAKKLLKEMASKSIGIALFVADTAKSFYRFLNMDITSEEFINEIRNNTIQTGAAFVGKLIANVLIPLPVLHVINDLVGGFIGYLIGAGIQKAIGWINGNEHSRELERYYAKLTDELTQKRIQLEKMLQDMLYEKSYAISNGFISLHNALINSDNEKIDLSLEMIISEFGGHLRFESQQAFDEFMLSDEPLFT